MTATPTWKTNTDPSALIREPPRAAILIVGYDGHPAGQAALRAAIDLASRMSAEIHVLHSITIEDYGIDPDIDGFDEECERNLAEGRKQISTEFANAAVRWTYHETRGDPASRLAHLAAETNAALIVVGASQRHMLRHRTGGGNDVPKRLLHHQRRPVLVVPA